MYSDNYVYEQGREDMHKKFIIYRRAPVTFVVRQMGKMYANDPGDMWGWLGLNIREYQKKIKQKKEKHLAE